MKRLFAHPLRVLVIAFAVAAAGSVLTGVLLGSDDDSTAVERAAQAQPSAASAGGSTTAEPTPSPTPTPEPATLPDGGREVFSDDGTILLAYYGAPNTPALGVLGYADRQQMIEWFDGQAVPFENEGHPVQLVFELIVTIADGYPGDRGVYSHDVDTALVQDWIDYAHEVGALVVLDLQPGQEDFLSVAQRWEWALRDPWVGLALDGEWRMPNGGVPGRVIGEVSAAEVNAVSEWLAGVVAEDDLPEKVLVLHQFHVKTLPDIDAIVDRPGLAMVQHIDGFGSPGAKLETYRTVGRPDRFTMGFKLFYDEDQPLMNPWWVMGELPEVRFISYQ